MRLRLPSQHLAVITTDRPPSDARRPKILPTVIQRTHSGPCAAVIDLYDFRISTSEYTGFSTPHPNHHYLGTPRRRYATCASTRFLDKAATRQRQDRSRSGASTPTLCAARCGVCLPCDRDMTVRSPSAEDRSMQTCRSSATCGDAVFRGYPAVRDDAADNSRDDDLLVFYQLAWITCIQYSCSLRPHSRF